MEVASLYYVMVDFDCKPLLFLGHFCSPKKKLWEEIGDKMLGCNDVYRVETGK